MARVQHPAIVRIHDVFYHNDDPWIVMEYVKGRPLAELIAQRSRLGEQEIARIGLPVLRGLSAAHRANVVHRDVKPANILVADDGSIFLVDFGIAKIAGRYLAHHDQSRSWAPRNSSRQKGSRPMAR